MWAETKEAGKEGLIQWHSASLLGKGLCREKPPERRREANLGKPQMPGIELAVLSD